MSNRHRKNNGRKHPLALAAAALLGLAALWFGVDPTTLRNNPGQTVERIGQAISQDGNPVSSGAAGAPVQSPAFLTAEAHHTITLIQRGGPYPHRQDGTTFQNRERRLPQRERGWYREYTVDTPGLSHRGARRIVTGGHPPTEWYYTADHYDSFQAFSPPAARSH